jgi:hypothetical protein
MPVRIPALEKVPKSRWKMEAAVLLDQSEMDHCVHAARWEVSQNEAQVTEWERRRLFEHI